MKLPMQTFTGVSGNSRFTFYETWFNKTIAIIEEAWWEDAWSIKSSVSIPKDFFLLLRAKCVSGTNPSNSNLTDTVETPFTTTIVYDCFQLPYGVRQLLFDIDCRNIPISENQLGCMTDLESLEWYWDIKSTPESLHEDSCSLSPNIADTNPDQIACDSPIKSETSPVKECPPASKKYRVEKFKRTALKIAKLDLADVWQTFLMWCFF